MAEEAAASTGSTQQDHQGAAPLNTSAGTNDCPNNCINGLILYKDPETGKEYGRICECQERRALQARFKNATIPEEYENARFKDFKRETENQNLMYNAIMEYLKEIPAKADLEPNREGKKKLEAPSFGFIAELGEMRLKEMPAAKRSAEKEKRNSYGIGKTHLTMAAAKYLINKGYKVFCISDVTYIADLMTANQNGDGDTREKLIGSATHYADIVVWDEIGRSRYSESREDMYYQIINEIYKQKKPLLFSSNEDEQTLEFKIGQAAFSRLRGMSRGNLYALSGQDMR